MWLWFYHGDQTLRFNKTSCAVCNCHWLIVSLFGLDKDLKHYYPNTINNTVQYDYTCSIVWVVCEIGLSTKSLLLVWAVCWLLLSRLAEYRLDSSRLTQSEKCFFSSMKFSMKCKNSRQNVNDLLIELKILQLNDCWSVCQLHDKKGSVSVNIELLIILQLFTG